MLPNPIRSPIPMNNPDTLSNEPVAPIAHSGDDHTGLWKWVAGIFLLALCLWSVCAFFGFKAVENGWSEKAGQFGDLFGTINALFACVAAVGAVTAVLLQRVELKE